MNECILHLWMVFFLSSSVSTLDEMVNTTSGWIQGKRTNVEGNDVLTFTGVPYAEPPTGNLRFKPPQLKSRMADVTNATSVPPLCPQRITIITELDRVLTKPFTVNGSFIPTVSEDCLYLNLFVPASANSVRPLPVMVWIHGGGFITGTAILVGGEVLAALNDVIVVTVNYRLGVLGFLDTGDDVSVGNFGLRDQILALRWIQANIVDFGGNASRVTIAGESTGAACVSQLILSPLTEGLFERAIIESGNPFTFWTHVKSPAQNAMAFGKQVGCEGSTTSLLVDCLRLKSMDEIITHQFDGDIQWASTYRGEIFPEDPTKYIFADSIPVWVQKLANTDTLMGNTKQEGLLFYSFALLRLRDKPNGLSEELFLQEMRANVLNVVPEKHVDNILPMVKYVYTDWKNAESNISRAERLTDLIGDVIEYPGNVAFARLHARSGGNGSGRLYFYLLNPRPSWMTVKPWTQGADHADDLFFVFGHPFSRSDLNATEQDKLLSRWVMTYWSNFVKTGNPNQPKQVPVVWPEYTTDSEQFLELDTVMTQNNINNHILADRVAFWTEFIPGELKRLDEMATPAPCVEQPTTRPVTGISSSFTGSQLTKIYILFLTLFLLL